MFPGRASVSGAATGGKGGKLSVEELYGFNRKRKVNKGHCGTSETTDKEESVLKSQILEAARTLMERRRLEIYLKECDVTLESSNMPYSVHPSERVGGGALSQSRGRSRLSFPPSGFSFLLWTDGRSSPRLRRCGCVDGLTQSCVRGVV